MLSILDQENIELLITLETEIETEITKLKNDILTLNNDLPSLKSNELEQRENLEEIAIMNSRKNQLTDRKELLENKLDKLLYCTKP